MRFFLRKILRLILVLLAVSIVAFAMVQAQPGSTAESICGTTGGQACIDQKTEELGLDDPLPTQYFRWLGKALTGDLGEAATTSQPVWDALGERLPVTIELLIYAQFLALLFAVPIALLCAKRAGGIFDRIASTVTFALFSIPNFVLAVLLVYVFAVELRWFPATGYTDFTDDPIENLRSLFLPAVSLAVPLMAIYMRLFRVDLITSLQEDYVTMAKAKGLSSNRILLRHAFKPSSLSLFTAIGINTGALIGGTFVIEVVFAINGIGLYTVNSIFSQDAAPVQGVVLITAIGYVLVNFLVDVTYGLLDPRIRHARALS